MTFASHFFTAMLAILDLQEGKAFAQWPGTPFTTNGRDVKTASGENFVYAGINWPGASETMLPEGLQ